MKKLLTTFLQLLVFGSFAQQTFISRSESAIYRVDASYNLHLVTAVFLPPAQIFDIAISANGTIYGIAENKILQIDVPTGYYSVLTTLPNSDYTSLTCDDNNNIYTIDHDSESLIRYNMTLDTVETIKHVGLSTPGDLCFYEGNIIFPSSGFVYAYNPSDHSLKKIFCLPDSVSSIWGFSNVFDSCGDERILATNNSGELWELDIDSGSLHLLKNQLSSIPILGMATSSEHRASTCAKSLQEVDCSISTGNLSAKKAPLKIYPNPTADHLTIVSPNQIQQVMVHGMSGELLLVSENVAAKEVQMNLEPLPNGVYLIEIIDDHNVRKVRKFIRQ